MDYITKKCLQTKKIKLVIELKNLNIFKTMNYTILFLYIYFINAI